MIDPPLLKDRSSIQSDYEYAESMMNPKIDPKSFWKCYLASISARLILGSILHPFEMLFSLCFAGINPMIDFSFKILQ